MSCSSWLSSSFIFSTSRESSFSSFFFSCFFLLFSSFTCLSLIFFSCYSFFWYSSFFSLSLRSKALICSDCSCLYSFYSCSSIFFFLFFSSSCLSSSLFIFFLNSSSLIFYSSFSFLKSSVSNLTRVAHSSSSSPSTWYTDFEPTELLTDDFEDAAETLDLLLWWDFWDPRLIWSSSRSCKSLWEAWEPLTEEALTDWLVFLYSLTA